jgi:hypothetical protein
VTKDVVSINDFVKDVTFEPCLLHKVSVELLKFHGGDKVFVSGVIVWVMGADASVRVLGATAKTMRILGDNFADGKPLSSQ